MPSPLTVERCMLELRIVPYTEGEHLIVRDVTQLKQLEGMRRNFFANVFTSYALQWPYFRGYLEMTEDPDMVVGPMWPKAFHGVMTE